MTTTQELVKLISCLTKPTERRVQRAREAICDLPRDEVIPALHEIVETSQDRQARYQIILLLSQFEDKRSIPVLGRLSLAKHPMIGQSAARALARFRMPEAYEELLAKLPEVSTLVAPNIIKLLGKSGYRPAIPKLIEIVRMAEWDMLRYLAIEALGLLRATEASALIQCYLTHDNHHVREYAKRALMRLRDTNDRKETTCS
jgi:HEAT repeat protein